MTPAQALACLTEYARGSDGAWAYWEIEEGRRMERFTGVIDPADPVSVLWAYRAACTYLRPTGPDRKKWLRLIEAYETLVTQ